MRAQSIAIPRLIETRYDAVKALPAVLKAHGFKSVLVLVGAGIEALFKEALSPLLEPLEDHGLHVHGPHVLEDLNVETLTPRSYQLPTADVIVAMGGGKAIDCGKYVGFLRGIPFISVPTSISNDGFASAGASLYVAGKRTSVGAKMPYGVIADLSILTTAPERFYYSGLGDVVSKIIANYDWQYEVDHGIGTIDHFAMLLAKKSVNSVVRLPFNYIQEGLFIKEVVDSLIMSGISMEVAGHSAPASGSEHLISHALDQIAPGQYLHGIQVGVATYLMACVQNHRKERLKTFLTACGFFDHVKSLNMGRDQFIQAISLAPTIKPQRYTTLHDPALRALALDLITTEPILCKILT